MLKRKPNKVKQLLREGKVVFGTCAYSFCPNIVEIAGYCGFDFCRIDNEHTWRQDSMLEHIIRAGEIGNITTLPRIDKDNPYLIRKVLEIGAGGFIIPDIENAQEVKNVVKAAKFPPEGERGYSPFCFSGNYGISDPAEWINWSNQETLVGIMVESVKAVENIDSITSVEGLDFILFGPGDYSMSIGLPKGNKNDMRVQDAIKRTIESSNKNGKYVMIGVGNPWEEEAKKYIDMGCKLIEVGHDYSILSTVWRKILKNIKS